jgi:cytochrome oxidase Cu insertion factor (SCO1/SenC/PrrC family)
MRRTGILAVCVLVVLLSLIGSTSPVTALEVGDKAPDFELPATTKEKMSLSEFLGKKHVVLFGFVGAYTPT